MAGALEAVAGGREGERNSLEERIMVEARGAGVAPEGLLAPLHLLSARLPAF